MRTAEQLLGELLSRLLVSGIRVDSLNESGKLAPAAEVPYGFALIAIRTGTRVETNHGAIINRSYALVRRR